MAGLTDRQLVDLYFHARDDEGKLKVPAAEAPAARPMTPDEEDHMMEAMALSLGMSQDKVDAIKERARARRTKG